MNDLTAVEWRFHKVADLPLSTCFLETIIRNIRVLYMVVFGLFTFVDYGHTLGIKVAFGSIETETGRRLLFVCVEQLLMLNWFRLI